MVKIQEISCLQTLTTPQNRTINNLRIAPFCCSNLDCRWEITTLNPLGRLYLEVTFSSLDPRSEAVCWYDFLLVSEGMY